MRILLEDKYIIAVQKEAGVPTQTASISGRDLVSEVKNYLSDTTKQKNPYLALINRLDQPVEGIVLFAKDSKSAANLSAQIQKRQMKKEYYAVISGHMEEATGTLIDYLGKDSKSNCAVILPKENPQGKKAELEYKQVCVKDDMELLSITLLTGRYHQIRVQFASRNHPLLGDTKYGTAALDKEKQKGIALCAYRLSFVHPMAGKEVRMEIEPTNLGSFNSQVAKGENSD